MAVGLELLDRRQTRVQAKVEDVGVGEAAGGGSSNSDRLEVKPRVRAAMLRQ